MLIEPMSNSSGNGVADAAFNIPPSALTTARVTTLCIWRLCVGFQSVLRPMEKNANETPTDFMSASVVISVAFLLVLLLAIICVITMEFVGMLLRTTPWYTRLSSSDSAEYPNIITLFETLNANCPLTPTAIPASTCPICLDDMISLVVTRRLPCSHTFHAVCIDRWVLQSLISKHRQYQLNTGSFTEISTQARCPICNAGVFSHKRCETRIRL